MKDKELKHFKQFHYYNSDQKLEWFGNGEWVEEPDLCCFKYKNISCFVIRRISSENSGLVYGGHLCGYCYVPKEHLHYGKDLESCLSNDIDIECHGGITFSRINYRNKKHLIGFDAAHSGDLVPSMVKMDLKINKLLNLTKITDRLNLNYPKFMDSYKNVYYIIEQIKLMVNSLI